MAVTAEDLKYLNSDGISAVKKATEQWEAANKTGNTAGMEAAKAAAAAARANAGYVTNPDGTYKSTITPTTSTTPTTTPTTQIVTPTTDTDIAQQIVDLLTSGGKIDYSSLNSLAAAREAKMATDPTKYSQFESTQSIIDRYLPSAKAAEEAAKLAETEANKNKELQSIIDELKARSTETSEIDTLTQLIKSLTGTSAISTDYTKATEQAEAQLNPQYTEASKTLKKSLDLDMEQRGIYNSPLASGIMVEKQGTLSNQQAQAIAELATTLQQNNNELSLQEKQTQLTSLNSLLSAMIGREVNLADITGTYNGEATQDAKTEDTQTAIDEASVTGIYNGQSTLAAQQLAYQKRAQEINDALTSVATLGKVTTQEQADLLGVPVGTLSQDAKSTAAELSAQLEMFYADLALQAQEAAASAAYSSATDSAQKFSYAMDVWQATGIAPAGVLQEYGVAAGTPYSSENSRSAQYKAAELEAKAYIAEQESEQIFVGRSEKMASTYGLNANSAQAMVTAISNGQSYEAAVAIIASNKKALKAEGVDIDATTAALKKYYTTQANLAARNSGK